MVTSFAVWWILSVYRLCVEVPCKTMLSPILESAQIVHLEPEATEGGLGFRGLGFRI